MAQYKYKARTLEGKVIKGIMTVADDTELQQKLHEQDAFLLSAKAVKSSKGMRQFKPKVLADFSRQMGTLIASGVTLVRALNIMANGESVKPKREASMRISSDRFARVLPFPMLWRHKTGHFRL